MNTNKWLTFLAVGTVKVIVSTLLVFLDDRSEIILLKHILKHVLNVLTDVETHRNRLQGHWAFFTKGFPGLGGGAACLCGTGGLDVLSAGRVSFILSGVSMLNRALNCSCPNAICNNDSVKFCYPDKRSPPLVSVGLSQLDAHREALHTCHLHRHPAI